MVVETGERATYGERIGYLEGVHGHLATKADLVEVKADLTGEIGAVKSYLTQRVFDNSLHVASRLSVRQIIAGRIHASEVLAHPAMPAQPRERTLHRPPLGKKLESAFILRTLHDFERAARLFLNPVHRLPRVSAVRPY